MIAYPNAKINLGLAVTARRPDGFHELETVFYPVGLTDILEVIPAPDGHFVFTASGIPVPGIPEENLCVKAWKNMAAAFEIPPVKIHLHKMIPMGSGLGGGSSDGAFTLRLLNKLFELNLPETLLLELAGALGSDCPFFIRNRPQSARGRGELLEPFRIDLTDMFLAIVIPPVHVSTAQAYSLINPRLPAEPVVETLQRPLITWKDFLVNDFEAPVSCMIPEIGTIKSGLEKLGAVYVSMSGSGSTVYGIFDQPQELQDRFPGCFIWTGAMAPVNGVG